MRKEQENLPEEDVEKIESTAENWENGKLGTDERYAKRSNHTQEEIEEHRLAAKKWLAAMPDENR
jgi:hypothetical protein